MRQEFDPVGPVWDWILSPLIWGLLMVSSLAQISTIQEGERFTQLSFPRLADGQPSSLQDFRGRKLVLHVFASW